MRCVFLGLRMPLRWGDRDSVKPQYTLASEYSPDSYVYGGLPPKFTESLR